MPVTSARLLDAACGIVEALEKVEAPKGATSYYERTETERP